MRRGNTQHLHRFDYGSECSNVNSTGPGSAGSGVLRCNLEVYGQPEPPVYDPAAITTPLALFTGMGQFARLHTHAAKLVLCIFQQLMQRCAGSRHRVLQVDRTDTNTPEWCA